MNNDSYTNGLLQDIFSQFKTEQCWSRIYQLFPDIKLLGSVEQDPNYHAEGDVGTHTELVVKNLLEDGKWQQLDVGNRFLLFWTAVFHDIGGLL